MGYLGPVISVLVFVVCPALFISIGFLISAHEDDYCPRSNTIATDIATPITIFVGCFVPICIILIYIFRRLKRKTLSDWGKIIRFVLSELRFPGFWDAKVRDENSVRGRRREERRDCCAVTCFFVYIIGIVLLLSAFLGVELFNSGTEHYNSTSVLLYNGATLFKPQLNTTQSHVYYRIRLDHGRVATVLHPKLVQGPIIDKHEDDISIYSYFEIASTFAPGSTVSLNVSSMPGYGIRIYYKVNDTIVLNNTKDTNFVLNFTEKYHTSYLILIDSNSSGSTRISYDFFANTTTYDDTFAESVYDYEYFFASKDAYIILWRNITNPTTSSYVDIRAITYDSLSSKLHPFVWKLVKAAVIILSILLIIQVIVLLIIVKHISRHSHNADFSLVEAPKDNWHESETPYGYLNTIVILLALISFTASGSALSLDDFYLYKDVNTFDKFNGTIHGGEQRFLRVSADETSSELGVSFQSDLGNVKFSALSDFPTTGKMHTAERNPGSVVFHYLMNTELYVTKNGNIHWDFTSDTLINVRVYDPNYDEVYYSGFSKSARDTFIPESSGVYTLRLTSNTFSTDTAVEFRSLSATYELYDLSKVTVWSTLHDIKLKHTNEPFKYLVAEAKDQDIKPDYVSVSLFEYDNSVQVLLVSSLAFTALLMVSVFVLLFVLVLSLLQFCGLNLPKYCCRRRVLVDVDEDNEKNIKKPLLSKEKPQQGTTDAGNVGTTEGGTAEGSTADGGTADGGTAGGEEYLTPDRDSTAPSIDESGNVSYTAPSVEEASAPSIGDLPGYSE